MLYFVLQSISKSNPGDDVPSLNSAPFIKPPMLVVLHDVASVFLPELNYIVEKLEPLVGMRMSAAIVPRWRGQSDCYHNVPYRNLIARFSERLLHGWTHQSGGRLRPISLMTDASDEFWGLDEATIRTRIERSQGDFRELTGSDADGFLPPAWQLPIPAARLSSVKFVMRFRRLELCREAGTAFPLATSSWDWGRIGWLGYGGELIGSVLRRYSIGAIPCVAIHPVDVRRGHFERAVKLITFLSENGHSAATASELMLDREDPS